MVDIDVCFFIVSVVLIHVNLFLFLIYRNQDISVGIAISYRLDGMGSNPVNGRFFSVPQSPDRLGAHPASYPMHTEGNAAGA
jgi:hypothetical protein